MNLTFIKKPMKNKVNAEKKIASDIFCVILPLNDTNYQKNALHSICTRN